MLPVSWQMGCDLFFRQRDVLVNDLHRGLGDRSFLLLFQRVEDGLVDVVGNFGRRAADQFDQGILQRVHGGVTVKSAPASVNGTSFRRQGKRISIRGTEGAPWPCG